MAESGMLCTMIHHVCHCQLLEISKPLKWVRINDFVF